jgi:hypothetical protein
MTWYDPSKSTTSKIRVSVRKLPWSPNVTGRSIFPKGYALMPGMIPRKGKNGGAELGLQDAHGIKGLNILNVEAAAPIHQHLGQALVADDGSIMSGWLPSRGTLGGWSPRSNVIGVLDQRRNLGTAPLVGKTPVVGPCVDAWSSCPQDLRRS